MAKFLGNVVLLQETNLPALFYYRHLLEERKGNPVYYYDEINKKAIDTAYEKLLLEETKENIYIQLELCNETIDDVTSTVYHGFKYSVLHENVKDEGLAKKYSKEITKAIKECSAPYDEPFLKYSVTIIQG